MKIRGILAVILITGMGYFTLRGCILAVNGGSDAIFIEGKDPSLPTLDLYTAGTATTPQLALFAGIRTGEVGKLFNLRVHLWKNPDELLSNVLIGKGDLWVGHSEGFAMARKRKAPVQLFVLTSFRKFFIISSGDKKNLKEFNGGTIVYSPPGSPAVPLLEAVMKLYTVNIRLEPHEGKELSVLLESGKIETAILPEPLVSWFLLHHKNFSVIDCVEDLFVKATGQHGMLPVAGIAVNEITARKYRDKFIKLQQIIIRESKIFADGKGKASRYFPPYLEEYISRDIVSESLKRDVLIARYGDGVRDELLAYLRIVHPQLFTGDNPIDRDDEFLWK